MKKMKMTATMMNNLYNLINNKDKVKYSIRKLGEKKMNENCDNQFFFLATFKWRRQ